MAYEALDTNKQIQQANKQTNAKKRRKKLSNTTNLLGHVRWLVRVADKPILGVHKPRDVRDHQEAGRNYHG